MAQNQCQNGYGIGSQRSNGQLQAKVDTLILTTIRPRKFVYQSELFDFCPYYPSLRADYDYAPEPKESFGWMHHALLGRHPF
jgi:hypothetical protein